MVTNAELTEAALAKFGEIVDATEGPLTILELGACDGLHTRLLAGALAARNRWFRYFAFEPDPALYEILRRAAPRPVQTVNAAIGAEVGRTAFWRSSGRSEATGEVYYGSGSIKRPGLAEEQWPGVRFDEVVEVAVTTLDEFVWKQGIERVDFIWSDIQGAEGDMIAGGRETLARTSWLYTEADGNGLYEGDVNEDEIRALLPDWESRGRVGDSLLLQRKVET